jgi:class 3 adenylate cyclase
LRGSFGVIQILAYVFIGYFSRGIRESVGNAVLGRLAACLTLALPIAVYHSGAQVHGVLVQYVGGWLLVAVAWAAQIGARMQASAERNESLRRNDQATIVAEMLRIQWRLSDHRTIVCVLVVDAAKSSEMKANADPLAVEYSFREYQDWIEAICEPNGGRVHNTAGDGAVVAFRDCRRAFDSARKLQTDLPRFNQEVNRLSTPFRLRVGLHVGQVAGELDEVEFTEVIDIAAHVQAVAPISGIAATDDVVTALEGEEFVPLAKTVDGHGVSLALNPIED